MFSNNEFQEMEEELKAEIARLRDELAATKASLLFHCKDADGHVKALVTERSAHEATKAELQKAHDETWRLGTRAETAEQRVAELERVLDMETAQTRANADAFERLSDGYLQRAEVAEAALSSARKLLARCTFGQFRDAHMLDDLEHWLRANPEPATPAATGAERAEKHQGQAGDETLRHLTECALAWEPEVRLLGNVTARQLQSFCVELARLRRENPDPECDNCGAVIDGNQAATSDVCHDCWRSARERACTPEERAVLEAWSEKHISDECLNFIIRCGSGPVCQCARAELENRSARRSAKNGGNGGSEV